MTKIVRLEAENFKRLSAVEINPDEFTVVIAGRNAQGKSSVLDAIQAALAGKKGVKELSEPIRQGESKARVVLELDDIRVERKWTPSGSQLVVGPKDGTAKFNSPQAVLDKLIGALSFDPLEFAQADPKTQVEQLIDAVGAREELETIAQQRKEAYEERTVVNRDVRRLEAELVAAKRDVPDSYDGTGPLDQQALSEEYGAAREKVALRERWLRLKTELDEIETRAAALPETRDVEVINDLLSKAVAHNVAAEAFKRAEKITDDLAEARREADALSGQIETSDNSKQTVIARASLPVPGLTFDEEGIQLNGVPFQQSSAAERLKVSVAMAMAMNPELRVICIRDASLLDQESFSQIAFMAAEKDYQIWYEVVGDSAHEMGVVIEDGAVQE
jgi:DNA repair exonuclease SbcCD ATPase subunit